MSKTSPEMNRKLTLLDTNLTEKQIKKLSDQWITTIEDLKAACNIEEGRKGILTLLEIEEEQLNDILLKACDLLPKEKRLQMTEEVEEKPLGLLLEKNREGNKQK